MTQSVDLNSPKTLLHSRADSSGHAYSQAKPNFWSILPRPNGINAPRPCKFLCGKPVIRHMQCPSARSLQRLTYHLMIMYISHLLPQQVFLWSSCCSTTSVALIRGCFLLFTTKLGIFCRTYDLKRIPGCPAAYQTLTISDSRKNVFIWLTHTPYTSRSHV